jgi:hypothetical protein
MVLSREQYNKYKDCNYQLCGECQLHNDEEGCLGNWIELLQVTLEQAWEENEKLKQALKEILDFKDLRLQPMDWKKYRKLVQE